MRKEAKVGSTNELQGQEEWGGLNGDDGDLSRTSNCESAHQGRYMQPTEVCKDCKVFFRV